MADPTTSQVAAPSRPSISPEELKSRNDWFVMTPDPWSEIPLLEFAGDRTYASTVNDMIVKAEFDQQPVFEGKLLEALANPSVTEAGRLFICRMLALVGTAKSVPALVPLLQETATADVARIALDAIDDSSVIEAYRAALGKLKGAPKAGLIGSIAMRGDVQSVDALVAIALDTTESTDVRTAAERAAEKLSSKA